MGTEQMLLVIAALVPAVFLCVYIYKKDRADKEPIGTLLLLLLCGVVICFPVVIVEMILGGVLNGIFSPVLTFYESGDIYGDMVSYTIYQFLHATIGVALVEEGFKWLVLILFAKKCKHFNSLFDGIIYAVFVSLGFAGFENILYVLANGWQTAIMRAVLSVPGHMFFAVLMGLFFSDYFMTRLAHQTELECRRRGLLAANQPELSETKPLLLSLIVPTVVHGLFDFLLFMGNGLCVLAFFALVVGMYIFCFKRIKSTSKQDTHAQLCILKKLETKYPGFGQTVAESGVLPQLEGSETAGIMPAVPTIPEEPAQCVRFAGMYTKVEGTVHIHAAPKQPLDTGSLIMTIQTPDGRRLPIIASINCMVDKYDVTEGQTVQTGKLLGVLKFPVQS